MWCDYNSKLEVFYVDVTYEWLMTVTTMLHLACNRLCSLDNALFLLSHHLLNYKAADRQLVYTVNIIDSYQESEVSPVGY